ncbi:Facilitated glucose transporter-like [Hondaea fermentalgiana]|uniref:Hexose transporter 1 n=1 Tax=Hondaea fermentalgiana TaxID=2315210 RepID=A0A2R5GQ12_9STRA|nr:Facilitated glucose transporter-like [Hondaea fermentalgiana]|eukprot:GBG32389.1 Facilitated glucose transporter-like [Hondaea fermentalgiana]
MGVLHVVVSSLAGGFYFGYNSGVVSGLTSTIVQCDFFPQDPISVDETALQSTYRGLFTACILVGGIIGAIVGVPFADKYGRRNAYVACGVVGSLALLQGICNVFAILILLRTVMGVAVGALSVIVPLYVTECCPPKRRGSIGTLFQVSICFSIFMAQALNYAFDPTLSADSVDKMCVPTWKWKLQLALGALPALFIILHGLLAMPESRDWLYRTGQIDLDDEEFARSDSYHSMAGMDDGESERRDGADAGEGAGELPAPLLIRAPSADGNKLASFSWRELLFTAYGLRWAGIGIGLACSAQLTGINAFIFYSPQIFKDAGFHNVLVLTLFAVGMWNFASVFVALGLVDKLGRRPLMLSALLGMTSSSMLLAVAYAVLGDSTLKSVATVAGLMGFIFFFELGPGSLFFLMASETFPRVVRSKALVFANVFNWVFNICVSFGFPIVDKAIGTSMTFTLLSIVGICSSAFIYFKLPETRGDLPPTPLLEIFS